MAAQRLNITLDDEHAGKLARLAARVHVNEGTLARSLLSSAIDDADPDLERLIAVLSLPSDARERVRHGLAPLADFPRLGPELTGRPLVLRCDQRIAVTGS